MKGIKKKVILFIILAMGLASSSFAIIVERVVAVVDNEIITHSDVMVLVSQYSSQGMDEGMALNLLIENLLVQKEAKRVGVEVSDKDVDATIEGMRKESRLNTEEFIAELRMEGISLADYKKQVKDNILKMRIVDIMLKNKLIIKDDDIKRYYETHQDEFLMDAKVKIQNILFTVASNAPEDEVKKTFDKARKVLELVKNGADYGELARLYSDGPAAKLGGDLGYFTKGELTPAMEKWALKLKEGEASEIIRTSLGLNIIKVTDRVYNNIMPLDEVREEIRYKLFSAKLEKQYKEWLEELKKRAAIEIMM